MAGVLALVGVLISGIAGASVPNDGVYTGCYATENGLLRIVDPAENCRANENRITWNAQGEAGPRGSARAYGEITLKGSPIGDVTSTFLRSTIPRRVSTAYMSIRAST